MHPLLPATALILLALAAPAHAVELGAADDQNLVGSFREGTVESMRDNGVHTLRLTAWQGRDHAYAIRSTIAARQAGLEVQVVLGVPISHTPDASFPMWAVATAREFADAGATRFSILNEPDLWIPNADRCDTDEEVRRTIVEAGYRVERKRIRTRVRRTRLVSRVARVKGKRTIVRKRVPMFRFKHVRRVVRGRSVTRRIRVSLYRIVYRTRTVLHATSSPRMETTLSPKAGCLAIHRARDATRTWDATVPALREALPGVEILLGETSPCNESAAFTREALRRGLPAHDGWAHHPYDGYRTGMENAETISDLVPVPVYWTEYGTHVRSSGGVSLQEARDNWTEAMSKARRLGVKQLVAYGWHATGLAWDTAAEGILWNP